MTVEIVILAMIAAFLGLRLYSVLGRRAEHEEEPIAGRFEGQAGQSGPSRLSPQGRAEAKRDGSADALGQASQLQAARPRDLPLTTPGVERGLREIAAADRRFDAFAFLDGARGAYRMILDAYWKGDKEALQQLCDEDVYASFASAIDARTAAGETLENKLIRIEDTAIVNAALSGSVARITMRFQSDIAAVTRDAEGQVIAGSLDDAVEAVDIWTFSRDVNSADPDWLLDETDEG